MSLFETSSDVGITQAETQRRDRWHGQHRPDTAALNGITNKNGTNPIPRVAMKDGKVLGSDGSRNLFFIGFQPNGWPGGSVGMKVAVPGGNVLTDAFNKLLFAWDFTTGTQYWNDPTTNINYMQTGILPDGSGGQTIARSPFNVADVY